MDIGRLQTLVNRAHTIVRTMQTDNASTPAYLGGGVSGHATLSCWSAMARQRQSSTVRSNRVTKNTELELLCSRSCVRWMRRGGIS